MKTPGASHSRRAFVGSLAAGALAAGATPVLLSGGERRHVRMLAARRYQSANDQAGKVDSRCDCFKKKEDGQITEATGIL